jgi:cyclase
MRPLVLALLLAAPPAHHDRAPADPFTLTKLKEGVYALQGRGGNVGFFVGPDSVLVVDSQFKDLAPGIEATIRSVTPRPVKWLVNTHHHGDHVGGNAHFRPFALILGHDTMRQRMLAFPSVVLRTFPARLEAAKKAGDTEEVAWLESQLAWAAKVKVQELPAPVLTFETELKVYLGDEVVRIWHTPPAHTDGDAVVYFERAGVLHLGDLFFNQAIPFIDANAGGSVKGYLTALDGVLSQVPAEVVIIPGHGPVGGVAQLKAFRGYIADLLAEAATARARGMSREAFVAAVDLPAYKAWEGYGERFKQNAGLAFDQTAP